MDDNWYDNPYFISNEIVHSSDYDVVNGFLTASYEFTPWLKASLRSGVDTYSEREKWRNSIGAYGGWNKKGYYEERRKGGYSINNDFMVQPTINSVIFPLMPLSAVPFISIRTTGSPVKRRTVSQFPDIIHYTHLSIRHR